MNYSLFIDQVSVKRIIDALLSNKFTLSSNNLFKNQ